MFGACEHLNDVVKPCVSYVKGGFCTRDDMFRCPEYMKRSGELPMSHTAIQDYCHCHRKYWHGWIQGLRIIEPSWQLKMGIRASTILGWLHGVPDPTFDCVEKYREFIWNEIEASKDPSDPEDVGALNIWAMKFVFDAYIELGWHQLKGVTEYEFRWNDPEYPAVHGYLDLALPGLTRAIEFKWTGSPQWYRKFHMEDQLMTYFIAAPSLQEFEVRLFVPPMVKFMKNEKMSQFIARNYEDTKKAMATEHVKAITYYRHEFDLEECKTRTRMMTTEIMRYLEMAETYPDPKYVFYQDKKACWTPFECDFLPICSSGVMPLNLYRKREKRS